MKSQRQIIREYNNLLERVKNDNFYKIDLTNRVNCYVCTSCGHITKSIDIDAGTTPFMFRCEQCNETARSSFYKDLAPDKKPTFEWFRPTVKQCLKMRGDNKAHLLEHVLQGGLDFRRFL